MEGEIWLPVPSKPGLLASSLGRIKLPTRIGDMPYGGTRVYEPKPTFGFRTRASKTARHEYMNVCSSKMGNIKVHRAVCEAFHGAPPFPRAVVIHLDENAVNNKPENLRWGTQKENLNAPGFIAYCKTRIGENSPTTKYMRKKKKQLGS
jgi:hypothetical protein